MNNVIRINTHGYTQQTATLSSLFTTLSKAAVGFYTAFCFAVYAVGYFMHSVCKFLRSDTALGMMLFYKLYLRMWVRTVSLCVVTVVVFGIEAGIVALSLCIPVILILLMVSKGKSKKYRG